MHDFGNIFAVPGTDKLSGKHIGAGGKSQKQVSQQGDQRTGGANGSNGVGAAEVTYYDNIRCMKQQLQNAGKHQWQYQMQQLGQDRPSAHIDCILVFTQDETFFLSKSRQ